MPKPAHIDDVLFELDELSTPRQGGLPKGLYRAVQERYVRWVNTGWRRNSGNKLKPVGRYVLTEKGRRAKLEIEQRFRGGR